MIFINSEIKEIKGMEILDSRGNPTVFTKVTLEDGSVGCAAVPSGASTGKYEAYELRDNDKNRYKGKGVLKAVENVNGAIRDKLIGMDALSQKCIDKTMIALDGTENKSNLGANAILSVSLAVAKAAAAHKKYEFFEYIRMYGEYKMPMPMMNILNGGAHSKNNVDIQEFMIVPVGAKNEAEAIRYCSEVYHTLGKILASEGLSVSVGDEGGYAPNLSDDVTALKYLNDAVVKSGYKLGTDIAYALDVASSEWYTESGEYILPKSKKKYSSDELIDILVDLCEEYPIISIEDGLAEEDYEGWKKLTKKLGEKIQLVGDDLFVTNTNRLQYGIDNNIANAILIKPNQIGTLTETMNAIALAQKNGYGVILSHRSGETYDYSISDIAVASCSGQIKAGAPCRGERTSKYNRLIEISDII